MRSHLPVPLSPQIYGVSSQVQKRPFDSSLNLSVHGLLVVDAMQTFGRDFELLVASHKNLFMDSRSGTIYDGSPQSPPGTPDMSVMSASGGGGGGGAPEGGLWGSGIKVPLLGDILQRTSSMTGGSAANSGQSSPILGARKMGRRGSSSSSRPPSITTGSPRASVSLFPSNPFFCPTEENSEALITFEYMDVSPLCPTNTGR